MGLIVEEIFGGENAHEDAVVLVVVLEGTVAADGSQAAEVFQPGGNLLDVLFVATCIDGIAAGNANDVAGQDGGALEKSSGPHLGRGALDHLRLGFGPNRVFAVAPV